MVLEINYYYLTAERDERRRAGQEKGRGRKGANGGYTTRRACARGQTVTTWRLRFLEKGSFVIERLHMSDAVFVREFISKFRFFSPLDGPTPRPHPEPVARACRLGWRPQIQYDMNYRARPGLDPTYRTNPDSRPTGRIPTPAPNPSHISDRRGLARRPTTSTPVRSF